MQVCKNPRSNKNQLFEESNRREVLNQRSKNFSIQAASLYNINYSTAKTLMRMNKLNMTSFDITQNNKTI